MDASIAIGQRFGCLTVIAAAGMDARSRSLWIVRCECGDERTRRIDKLELAPAKCRHNRARTETHSATREYSIWVGMRARCRDQKRKEFRYYGGRGIKVCERWELFENFLADMGAAPPGLTIDRYPDADGDYEATVVGRRALSKTKIVDLHANHDQPGRPHMTDRIPHQTWYSLTYWPRCLILLAKHRSLPSNMSLTATLRGIALRQVRPHWLRG